MIIRKLRLDKGLSQEQLASMAGINTRTLQRIERGANASPETLKCLAAVLETDFTILRKQQQMPEQTTQTRSELSKREREAMEYVRDIKSFYNHAIIYILIIGVLAIYNVVSSPQHIWVIWPAFGWGIGLAVHGLSVFEAFNLFGSKWEKRQIQRRLQRK